MMTTQRKPGFTLFELIIVVAILVMMLAVAMPLFFQSIAQRRLTGAVERLAADLRYARSVAVTQGNPHRLRVDGAGRYCLERNTGAWVQVFPWYDVAADYQGSSLQSLRDHVNGNLTNVTFNSQGAVDSVQTGTTNYPITLTLARAGTTRCVQVLRAGAIRVQCP